MSNKETERRYDRLSAKARSLVMSRVRGRNTGPERLVARLTAKLGYQYRQYVKDLPGTPDLVFPGRKRVVFVHGCFWHGHNCKAGRNKPKSNLAYWRPKLARNKQRDQENQKLLKRLDWKVLITWTCELNNEKKLTRKLKKFLT